MTSEAKCPYCDVALKSFPQRKTTCPGCRQSIYSRTDPKTRKKILVKEDELDDLEGEWTAIREGTVFDEESFIKKWKKKLADFEVGNSEYEQFKSTYPSKNEHDVIYAMFNHLLLTRGPQPWPLHYAMAEFLNDEGKDPYHALYANAKQKLLQMKDFEPTYVVIVAGENSCPECAALDGKQYTYKQALEEMPLPHKGCTFILKKGAKPFCRCTWVSRF